MMWFQGFAPSIDTLTLIRTLEISGLTPSFCECKEPEKCAHAVLAAPPVPSEISLVREAAPRHTTSPCPGYLDPELKLVYRPQFDFQPGYPFEKASLKPRPFKPPGHSCLCMHCLNGVYLKWIDVIGFRSDLEQHG